MATPNLPGLAAAPQLRRADLPGTRDPDHVAEALPVFEALPFPVLWIRRDFQVRWSNPAARREFGPFARPCHEFCQGLASTAELDAGKCPKRSVEATGECASVLHAHATIDGPQLYKITAVPVGDGSVLEFHVPLHDLLARDTLTGLPTRQVMEHLARRTFDLMVRLDRPLAVLMIDLDHFKRINDRHGHAAGDAVLAAVGEALATGVRATDLAARWGGEEFLIVLPGTDAAGALRDAQRLADRIHALRIAYREHALPVTASIGIWAGAATVPFEQAVEQADAAMYRAKQLGRDRVELCQPLPIHG